MKSTNFLSLGILLFLPFFEINAQILINEFYADVASGLVGDANGDGIRNAREDEFIELVNSVDTSINLKGFTIWVSNNLRHEFTENTILPAQSAIIIFGGGQPTGFFGNSLIMTANSGTLGLGNSGAKVELKNRSADIIEEFTYPDKNINASWTRDPDILGAFRPHHLVLDSYGSIFSPGTLLNSFPFGLDDNTYLHFHTTKGITSESDSVFQLPVYLINPSATTSTLFTIGLTNNFDSATDFQIVPTNYFAFSANEEGLQYIPIPIFNDELVEGAENFEFTITAIQGGKGASININQFFVLTIEDDDFDFPLLLNEIHADPAIGIEGDANGDGDRNAQEDEFLEFVNISDQAINLSGFGLFDKNALRHKIPTATIIEPNQAYVIFGGGIPSGNFGNAIVQTASTNGLNLVNSGDKIVLKDSNDVVVYAYTYQTEAAHNQSITRFPDLEPRQINALHSEVSDGQLFSPGKTVLGTNFSIRVATANLKSTSPIYLFPNPATTYIDVDAPNNLEIGNVELLSTTGILVNSYFHKKENRVYFDLPVGIYFLKAYTSQGIFINKLLIN